MKYDGIPENITLAFVEEWARPRISSKRFKHTEGVVSVGKEIAKAAKADVFLAQLCGWLHDACKEVKDKELVRLAREYGLELDPILESYGHLLHGPVAAEVAKRELGITNIEVYCAVAEHTLGNVPMTELSKIVFLADCLEASRPDSYTKPIWKALDLKGDVNLDAAVAVASDEGLKHLIEDKKSIHPRTVAVRNFYLPAARNKASSTS